MPAVEHAYSIPLIAEGMARAEMAACRLGGDRFYAFPNRLVIARAICNPKGRSRIGLIATKSGRDSLDVRLDVQIVEGR